MTLNIVPFHCLPFDVRTIFVPQIVWFPCGPVQVVNVATVRPFVLAFLGTVVEANERMLNVSSKVKRLEYGRNLV